MTLEDKDQIAVNDWSLSVRGRYPDLKMLHHVANERSCSPAQGARLKRMGVKAGVPDLELDVARYPYHGLRIEMKREEGGRLSDTQRWWIEELNKQGYAAVVCHGWESAIRTIEWYLNFPQWPEVKNGKD